MNLINKTGKGVKSGTWNKKENHVIFAIWLGKKMSYTKMEDWYQITKNIICDNYGGGLLSNKYGGSPLKFLKSVFPEVEAREPHFLHAALTAANGVSELPVRPRRYEENETYYK